MINRNALIECAPLIASGQADLEQVERAFNLSDYDRKFLLARVALESLQTSGLLAPIDMALVAQVEEPAPTLKEQHEAWGRFQFKR